MNPRDTALPNSRYEEPTVAFRRTDESTRRQFLADVVAGLRATPKRLPSKYFYDQRGSQLFDRICQLEEYYPTRCELAIMDQFAGEMGEQIGPGVMLVEFGSGSSVKIRHLLDNLPKAAAYVPVDISGEHLQQASIKLARDYPHIEVLPVCADFTEGFSLPEPSRDFSHVAVYFPGSTIGNLVHARVVELLRRIADMCGVGGGLLLGVDLKKDAATIEAAYNDAVGVTAQFNLNLLRRINRELDADFDLESFTHGAIYNAELGRVETHLVACKPQTVHLDGESIHFTEGETICTEYSQKYSVDEFAELAAVAGFELHKYWTDKDRYFAVMHLVVAG